MYSVSGHASGCPRCPVAPEAAPLSTFPCPCLRILIFHRGRLSLLDCSHPSQPEIGEVASRASFSFSQWVPADLDGSAFSIGRRRRHLPALSFHAALHFELWRCLLSRHAERPPGTGRLWPFTWATFLMQATILTLAIAATASLMAAADFLLCFQSSWRLEFRHFDKCSPQPRCRQPAARTARLARIEAVSASSSAFESLPAPADFINEQKAWLLPLISD